MQNSILQKEHSSSSKNADSQGNELGQEIKLLSQKSNRNGRISKQDRRASRLKQGQKQNNSSFVNIRNFDEDHAYHIDSNNDQIQNSDQIVRKKYRENEYRELNDKYRLIDNDDEVEQTEQSRISQSENILFNEEQQVFNMKNECNSRNPISCFFANNHTSEFKRNKSKEYFSNDGDHADLQKVDVQNYFSNSRVYYQSLGQQIDSDLQQSDKIDEKMSVIQEASMQSSTLAISKPASNSKKDEISNVDQNGSMNRQSVEHYSRRDDEDDEDEPSLQSPNIQQVKQKMKSTESTVTKNYSPQLLQNYEKNEPFINTQLNQDEDIQETESVKQQYSLDLEQRDHLSESPKLPINRNINRREQQIAIQDINHSYSTHNAQQQKQLQFNIESGKKIVKSGNGFQQLGMKLMQNQSDYQNLSEKKKIFEGNINMNVKVMEYDRIKINEQSPDVRDFNGLIEPNSPTAQDINLLKPESNTPLRMPSQDFQLNNQLMSYRSKSQNNLTTRSGNIPLGSFTQMPSAEVQAHLMQIRQNSCLFQQAKNLQSFSPFEGKRNCMLNQSQPHFESLYNQKFQLNNTNQNPLLSPFQGKCLSQHDSMLFQNDQSNQILNQSRFGPLIGSEINQLCQSNGNLQFNQFNQNNNIHQQMQYNMTQPLRGDSQILKNSINHNIFEFDSQSQVNNNILMNHIQQQPGEQYEVLLRERGDFIEKINQQQKTIENLKKEIKKNVIDHQNQSFTITELKQDIEEQQQNIKDKDNFITDLKETMKRQNEQIDQLREDLNSNQSTKSFAAFEILKKKNQELILQNQKLMKEKGESDQSKKYTLYQDTLNNTLGSNFSILQTINSDQAVQSKQKEIYSLTVELGMLREENSELKKNIQILKDDFQLRLKEQKERHEDDYNKLLEKNMNFDFEQNQKQSNNEDLQSMIEMLRIENEKLKKVKNDEIEEIKNELNQKIEENKQIQKLGHLQKLEINQLTYNYKMLSQQLDDLHKQINESPKSKLELQDEQQMKIQVNTTEQDINEEMQASMSKTFEYEICEAPHFKSDYGFDLNNQLKNSHNNLHDSRIQNNRDIISKISFRNNEEDSIAQDKFGESCIQQIQFFKHDNNEKEIFKNKYLNDLVGRDDEQTLSENIPENIHEIEQITINRTSFQAKLKIESSPQKIVLTTCNEEDDLEKQDSLSQFQDQEKMVNDQINCDDFFTHNPAEKDISGNIETYQESIIDIQDKKQDINLQLSSQKNMYLENLIQYEIEQYEKEDRCMPSRSISQQKIHNEKKEAYDTFQNQQLDQDTQNNTFQEAYDQKDRPALNLLNQSIEQKYQQIFTPENKSANRISKICRMMSARSPIQGIRNNVGNSMHTGSSSRVLYKNRKSITNDNTNNYQINKSQCDKNSNLQSIKQSGKNFNQIVSQVKNSKQNDGLQSSLSFINSQRIYEPIENSYNGQKSTRDFQVNATNGHSSKQSFSIGSKLLSQRRKIIGKSTIPSQLEKSQSSIQIKNNFQKQMQRQTNQNLSITSRDLNTKLQSYNHLNRNQSHSELPQTVVQSSKYQVNQKLLQSKQKQLDFLYKSKSFFGETSQSIQKQQYSSCQSSMNFQNSNKQQNTSQMQTSNSQNTFACSTRNNKVANSQYVMAIPEKKQKQICGSRPSMFICQISQTKQGLTPVIQESSFDYKNQTSGYATYEQLPNQNSGKSSQYNSNNISAKKTNRHNFNKNLSPQIKQSSNSKNLSSSKQMLLNQIEELGETMTKKVKEEKGDQTERHQIQKFKASSKTASFLQNSHNQFTRPCITQRTQIEDVCLPLQQKTVREELENTSSSMVLKEGLIRMASNQRLSLRYNQPLSDTLQYDYVDAQPFQSQIYNKVPNKLNVTDCQIEKNQCMTSQRVSKLSQAQTQNDKKIDVKQDIKQSQYELNELQNSIRQLDTNEIVSPEIFRSSIIASSGSGFNASTLKDLQKKEKIYQNGKAYLEKKIQEYESRLNQMKAKKEKAARSKVMKEQL